jgi:SAM-dependent methyltransferase
VGIDWSKGDYAPLARTLEPASAHVIDVAAPSAGADVLDVACGTGNSALLAADRGARVVGTDAEPSMLTAAAQRASDAGVEIEWATADATALPCEDGSFDLVISVFGVMFAPADPAAAELARVLRPAGRAVITTWIPAGPIAASGRKVAEALKRHRPDAMSPPSPEWGRAEDVVELLGRHRLDAAAAPHELSFSADSAEAWVSMNERNAAVWVAAREAMSEDEWAALRSEIVGDLEQASEVSDAFAVRSPYLLIEATPQTAAGAS